MSRTTILVLIALGAALAGFAFSSAANRVQDEPATIDTTAAARPQTATLRWRETYGRAGQQLVFSVETLQVMPDGWRARVAVENDTTIAYEVGDPRATLDRFFGLMLFSTGDPAELEEQNTSGTLPAIRPAVRYEPRLPAILEPGASWAGTISAPGALVADSWVRVVFGALVSVGPPPKELDENVTWITDRAYKLQQ